MRWIAVIALFNWLFLLVPISSLANESSELMQQRKVFQQAQKALKTNQIHKFETLKSQLDTYPLQPYLDYLYLRHKLQHVDDKTIIAFLDQQAGTFYAQRLRNSWLNRLASDKKWALYLTHYRPSRSTARQCHRLHALLATGDKAQAFADVAALWLVAKSQHKACDPVFKQWQQQGLITDALRQQRILLALGAAQFSLADYLAKSLAAPAETKKMISRWRQAHRSPQTLLKKLINTKIADSDANHALIHYAIKRLARRSTDKAFAMWQAIQVDYDFSQQQADTIQTSIAMRAALNREPRSLEYFANIPNQPWRVRSALWQQNWPAVQKAILSLDIELQQSPRWQYWLARSQDKLGDKQAAIETYQTLISKRDYYGFLAADKLNKPYQMNHNPLQFEDAELQRFSQRPAVARLTEFYALNMSLESRRQAYALKQHYDSGELQLLAHLTHQWNWYHQTIALLGKAQYWDALNLRFPVVFDNPILKASKKNGLDASWLFGIARQESAFNALARSPVGARGLMQLMPKTAVQIARRINKPLKKQAELLDPSRNIQLGSAYLRYMYDKNQHNPVLATASYNAGPHRIARWLPDHALPADIWIENIPYKETRRYTRSVLSYAAIFDYQRNRKITPLTERMPAVHAKKQ